MTQDACAHQELLPWQKLLFAALRSSSVRGAQHLLAACSPAGWLSMIHVPYPSECQPYAHVHALRAEVQALHA